MIRGFFFAAALCALILNASPATAGPQLGGSDAQSARMTAAFQAMVKRFKFTDASFAVMRGDKVLSAVSVGGRDAWAPTPLGNLSMSVTAVCVAKLVEAGRLKYKDRIGRLLKPFFKERPKLVNFKDRTVRDLVTHNGVARNYIFGEDGAYEFRQFDPTKPNLENVFALGLVPGGVSVQTSAAQVDRPFSYNVANYAGLGLVIQAVTGKTYTEACSELVLAPAGVTNAYMDPNWEILSSWGGWNMSAVDYARFLNYFRPGAGLLKAPASKWPKKTYGWGPQSMWTYSLGMYLEPFVTGRYDIRRQERWDHGGPVFSAHYKMYRQNLRYVMTYAAKVNENAAATIELALDKAAFPVSTIAATPSAFGVDSSGAGEAD